MNVLERLSRHTGAFVLGVDHFGKLVETGTRGSSAKEAAADVVLAMLADRDMAGNVSNTRMAVRKLRGGATGIETAYKLEVVDLSRDEHHQSVTTCIVRWSPPSAAPAVRQKERWPQSLRILRTAVTAAMIEHGEKRRPFGSEGQEVFVVAETKVRAEFAAAYPVDGTTGDQRANAKRKAFTRALKTARDKELVISREIAGIDYIWLPDAAEGAIHREDRRDTP